MPPPTDLFPTEHDQKHPMPDVTMRPAFLFTDRRQVQAGGEQASIAHQST